jgi:hypothetical protein
MEKSWKVVEHIRDGREGPAWEAAQALAKAVLETRQVMLAAAVLKGGPYALRRALELAELVLNEASRGEQGPGGKLTAAVR